MLVLSLPAPPSRRWLAAGLGVAAAGLGAWAVYHFLARNAAPEPVQEVSLATRRANLETCSEGAHLFHDVRWAAACMVLAQQDPSRDGSTECELPDASAARLYELLADAERRCFAEARRP
jgi:hypothetical protein